MIDQLTKKIASWFVEPIIRRRIQRTDVYTYKDITLHIPPGVFHPKYFFSTKYLLGIILKLPITGKQLLELGAGSGLISFMTAKAGALVTATDISAKAIQALKENANSNGISLRVIESDLFEAIPQPLFDYIIINPPYYPEQPRNDFEQAWYCGSNFEYYHRLFPQLCDIINGNTTVLMILADGCDIDQIKRIAQASQLHFTLFEQKKIWWENQFIFSITKL